MFLPDSEESAGQSTPIRTQGRGTRGTRGLPSPPPSTGARSAPSRVNSHLGQLRGAANPEVCFYFSATLQSRSQGVVYTRTLNKVKQNKIPLLAFIRNCLGQMASYRERGKGVLTTLGFLSCRRPAVIIANDPQLYTLPPQPLPSARPHLAASFLFKHFSSQPCTEGDGGSFMMDQPSRLTLSLGFS